MNSQIPLEYDIGFADSQVLSYHSENDHIIVILKCWNESVLELKFIESILVVITNSWNISDICETTDSTLLNEALSQVYDIIPKNHGYKTFQFLDHNDNPSIEIVSKNVIIRQL